MFPAFVVKGLNGAQCVQGGERGAIRRRYCQPLSTATPLLMKKFFPGVLVADGPVNELKTSTGLSGAAASNSASVGSRFSANCAWRPAAHGGDPVARLHGFHPRADRCLNVSDRGRGFEPRVVTGAQTEQQEMVVVVDEPRNGRAPAEIDHLHAGATTRVPIVAD